MNNNITRLNKNRYAMKDLLNSLTDEQDIFLEIAYKIQTSKSPEEALKNYTILRSELFQIINKQIELYSYSYRFTDFDIYKK